MSLEFNVTKSQCVVVIVYIVFLRFYPSPCIVCMFMGHELIDLSIGSTYCDESGPDYYFFFLIIAARGRSGRTH